jgi:hypothetical protein
VLRVKRTDSSWLVVHDKRNQKLTVSEKVAPLVMPAQAGIHTMLELRMDSRLRGNDTNGTQYFLRFHQKLAASMSPCASVWVCGKKMILPAIVPSPTDRP